MDRRGLELTLTPFINIVLLVMSALFALVALGHELQVLEAQQAWATGRLTEGTLTAHYGRRKSNMREYSYTYRVDGKEYTAERRTIPWSAREIPVGARLEVRYDPMSPAKSVTPAELEELQSWGSRWGLAAISAAFFAWAIARIVRGRRKPAT